MLGTSLGFLIATIRHKVKTRHLIRPTDQMVNNERRQAVVKGLWSSKGVWILAMVRLTLHLPFFALIETELRESNKAFFVMWFMPMMMSFWDSGIYVAFHKGMRKRVASYISCWKSNGIRNTQTKSTRVNVLPQPDFLEPRDQPRYPPSNLVPCENVGPQFNNERNFPLNVSAFIRNDIDSCVLHV